MTQYWDATKISALKRCPQYFQYSILDRWQPAEGNVHLAFGAGLAKALEIFYGFADRETGMLEAVRHCMGVKMPPDNNKNRITLVRTLVWYLDEYASDEIYTLSDGSAGVEVSFEVDVTDDIVFCGHLDTVVTKGGELYVVDQKTSKNTISRYFFDQWKLSDQMAMYSFVAKEVLGSPIRGVIIDGIQIAVGFTAFHRDLVQYPKERIDEWLRDTLWYIDNWNASNGCPPPRNFSSCPLFGGCRFRKICQQAGSVREQHLKQDFEKVEPWRPEVKR